MRCVQIGLMLLLSLIILTAATSHARQSPELIPVGGAIAALLMGDEVHEWGFNASNGDVISVSVERFPPDPETAFDPILELYAPNGSLIANDDDSGPGQDAMLIGLTLPADGQYRVVVRDQSGWAGGTYLLSIGDDVFPDGCQTPNGTLLTGEMPSTIIGNPPVRYRVFLPPCHEVMARRYPYVLLMHGSNTDDRHFDDIGMDEALVRGMALNRLPPMALVMPYGTWLANTNTFGAGNSWEYVVLDELLPYMENHYCLQSTREGRVIGGISRGGFWAFLIGLRNPAVFSAIGGHSPFFDLYHAPATHNPLDLAQSVTLDPAPRIWIDRGQNDYAMVNIDLIHERLTANQITHTFQLYSVGQHANNYWSAHTEEYLRFYGETWTDDYTELPPCTLDTRS